MFNFVLESTVAEGGGKDLYFPTFTPSYLLLSPTPLVKISFSLQPSASTAIKDGGHNFRQENTEHSLAKVTPALQVTLDAFGQCFHLRLRSRGTRALEARTPERPLNKQPIDYLLCMRKPQHSAGKSCHCLPPSFRYLE